MCSHSSPLEDVANGCLVCLDCGIILEEVVFGRGVGFNEHEYELGGKIISWEKGTLENTVRDILAVMFIENENVVGYSCDLIRELRDQTNGKFVCLDQIVAYCVFEALCREEIARSPGEVANACNVSEASILKCERFFKRSPAYCPPYLYCDRICATLGLDEKFSMKIKHKVASLPWIKLCRPETLVAAVLQKELDQGEEGLKMRKLMGRDLEVNVVCQKLGVSVGSVYNMMKQLGNGPGQDVVGCC